MTVSSPSSTYSPSKGGRLPWSGLLALSCAAFAAVMTELLPAGLLPAMAPPLGVAESRIGFLVTAYAAASFLAAVPLTAALRGLPRRPVLCAALLGFALSNALVALSSSYPLTFAARLLAGAMGGTLWAMLAGYAARMVPAARRGRAIAVVLAGITLALSLGVPAGSALAGAVGWRPAFGTLAVLAVLLVAWIRLRVPGFPGEPPHARVPLTRVARRPGIRPVLSVTLFLLLGHQVMYTYVAPFAAHAGYGRTGLLLAVFGTATVAGIWLTGALIDRWPRRTLLGALALFAGVLPVLGLAAGVHALLVGAVAVWGVAFGGAPTLIQTALVDASGPADADVATSLQTTVYNAGIAAGSFTGGVALDRLGAGALPWTALAPALVALGTVAAGRRHAFPAVRRAVAPEADTPAGSRRVAVACTAGDHSVRRSVDDGEGQ
ncbi:MFS transporter [Streptomyces broussonetiae]|uniref:MFS transporter n=1 Tax=Streptomyces broussonetiae TaxID=2686304 RepID=A0A6I6MXE7_9ACTN|nr:MFS transporter [Streptomyces broussonetiae]QHA02909.1 MFS transporter [Streptomyces broussonetiae]